MDAVQTDFNSPRNGECRHSNGKTRNGYLGGRVTEVGGAVRTVTKNGAVEKCISEGATILRRISPRLHKSLNISKVLDVQQVQRRLSPRLHPNSRSSMQDISSASGAKRRFSPIIPKGKMQKVVPNESNVEKSVGPRLPKNKMEEDSCKKSGIQRRISTRLHHSSLNDMQVDASSQSIAEKKTSLRLAEDSKILLKIIKNGERRMGSRHNVSSTRDSGHVIVEERASPTLHGEKRQKNASNGSSDHQSPQSRLQEDISMVFNCRIKHSHVLYQSPESMEEVEGVHRRLNPVLHDDPNTDIQPPDSKGFATERRSPRIQKIPQNKRPYYGTVPTKNSLCLTSKNILNKHGGDDPKRIKIDHPEEGSKLAGHWNDRGKESYKSNSKGLPADKLTTIASAGEKMEKETTSKDDASSGGAAVKSAYARVKETLRIFNTYYLQFVQEEEERCKKIETDNAKQEKGSNTKNGSVEENVKRSSKRPDLKAISKMVKNKEILYPEKKPGDVPGIDVGYQFYSRAEMVAVGFHSHWLNGIDYMGETYSRKHEYKDYTFPIAVAIVLSGQYEDNLDKAEDIIYTGQGGNDLLGNKRQVQDQVMLRGNLALKNNMEQSVPVRVVRGHGSANSYCGKVYTYDGLYKVVEYWAEKGVSGFTVFKYRLRRLTGQPRLTTNQVQFVRGCSSIVLSQLPGLVCSDISNGLENIPIPVTNLFDDPPIGPTGFTYSKAVQVAESVNLPPNAPGCNCKGNCTNPNTCACAKLNGSDFPYVRRDGGRLVEAKDVVFECGPNCGCGPGCINRTSQRGLKYRLEVYRTPNKGWAVRSWDFIPSGAPVCEYIGVVRRSDELDNVTENDYIFEIDCWHTMNEIEGRERRFRNVLMPTTDTLRTIDGKLVDGTPEFCIDAGSIGNVARFINHSCEPNLFVQCVLSSHHDLQLARVVLYAADNIPPLQELSYDYGYALDSVIGPEGKIKVLPCYCGTADCRRRLY